MPHQFYSKATGFFAIMILVILFSSCKKCDCDCNCPIEPSVLYWEHFIAHAGGAIDGINYTNSVEALNLSYSKGSRLFELDLRLTTDDQIVATHDPIEVSEEEFMSTLIFGKYAPMNMQTINEWFRKHPDAILVTDKINDPQRIFDEFLFPNRVIMELFSWEAVDKAIELGIKPMVSENLIFGKSEKATQMGIPPTPPMRASDLEQIFEEKKIEYICMSRYFHLIGNENLLQRLKTKGIKNYVFNLELPVPISGMPAEKYVWYYEMNFCYGMYANDLDLLKSLQNDELTTK